MPRFHFDLRADGITIPDHEGLELPDEGAAREEAARAAGEMMRERSARNAEPQDIARLVRDGSSHPVCTVTVALSLT
jgi:hypothetical protein